MKARVITSGEDQLVTIPAEFRFKTDEVYVKHDPRSGAVTLSEVLPRPTWHELFAMFDEAGAADFVLERDMSPPDDKDLF